MGTTKTKNQYALQFKNVQFHYDTKKTVQPILQDVSFTVNHGEFVSIVGASGTGKSTIFRLIVGLEQPNHGTIYVNGVHEQRRLGKVGYMPQQDLLMPWRTIRENAALPLEIKKQVFAKKDIDKKLEEFGLKGYEEKYPHELSGGMRQRVSFLRASLAGSNLLLLDEPFSALDAMTKLFMQEWLLTQWEKRKSTILFITHDISEALFLSDRIFVISDKPMTKLEKIDVPLERPRKQADLNQNSMIELKTSLIERFRMKV